MSQEETPEEAHTDAPTDAPETEQAIAVAEDTALDRTVDDLADADLKLVIALQKAELDRLLRENANCTPGWSNWSRFSSGNRSCASNCKTCWAASARRRG